jgi:hypothetical protein
MTVVEYGDAAATPDTWWPDRAQDPRDTRAWASAIRWTGDGVSFAGLPAGPSAALRRGPATGGWSRMNAVEVCGGTFRGADPPAGLLQAARTYRPRQLVAAAHGYGCPVLPGAGDVAELATALASRSRDESASFAVLHIPSGSAVAEALRAAGFVVGATDLYPFLELDAAEPDGFVAAQPYHRRQRMRREVRAFAGKGGRLDVLAGAAAGPVLSEVAVLEERAAHARGEPLTSAMAAEVNARIFAEFGADAYAVLVRDASGTAVACAVLVGAGTRVLLRTVGMDPDRARPLGAYFQAVVYGPLAVAARRGARTVLLGPGSLEPKLLRGARLVVLVSAVPGDHEPLAQLLRRTDGVIRARAAQLGEEYGCPSDC